MTARFSQISRFLATAAGTVILLASGQAFASTVVVTPAPVYVAPAKVVVLTSSAPSALGRRLVAEREGIPSALCRDGRVASVGSCC